MPTIVVVVRAPEASTHLIGRLRVATGMAISDIRRAITAGTPLVSERLFFNDHEERAAMLRRLVAVLVDERASADAFELDEGDEFGSGSFEDHRIELAGVLKILAERDRLVGQIHDSDDLLSRVRQSNNGEQPH